MQVFKLLFSFAKSTSSLKFDLKVVPDEKDDATEDGGSTKNFKDRFYRSLYELQLRVSMIKSNTQLDDYFLLLYRAIKADDCVERVAAFVRRMLQMCLASTEVNFVAATLLLLSEILRQNEQLRSELFGTELALQQTKKESAVKIDAAESDSEEEAFIDVDKHMESKHNQAEEKKAAAQDTKGQYMPFKREPKYAGATSSQPFELMALCEHTHPTIRSFASHIIFKPHEQLQYGGDPLLDFSLSNFLDRISYKEPKSQAKLDKFTDRQRKMSEYTKPVNAYDWDSDAEDTAADAKPNREDEQYIYEFMRQKAKDDKKKGKLRKRAGEDDDELDMNEDEEAEAFAADQI